MRNGPPVREENLWNARPGPGGIPRRRNRLDPAFLPRAAAVVRNGGHIFNRLHVQAGGLQGGDGAFATGARPLHPHIDIFHAEFHRLLGGLLRGALAGEGGALAAPLEAAGAGAGPAERVALGVGDRDGRIVERRLDVSDADRNVATGFLFDFDFSHCDA